MTATVMRIPTVTSSRRFMIEEVEPGHAAVSASSTRIVHGGDDDGSRRRPADALRAGLGNVTLIGADEGDRDAEHHRLEQAVNHLERAEAESQSGDEVLRP